MKTKYYTKLLLPLCLFCALFRFLELAFAVEYSIDSYFYINGSIIPTIFNVFIILCVVFFLSYWGIEKFKDLSSPEKKEERAYIKELKAKDKDAYKAYINDSKKDVELNSEFSRMKKFDAKTTILYVVASILILASSAQLLLDQISSVSTAYNGIGSIFATLPPYIFITALLSVLFFVQFSASPKSTAKGKFWMLISFAPALFYTLLVFYEFQAHSGIISKVFVAFDFLKIAAIALALISIPQLFISSSHKGMFFSASLVAVFLSTIRFTDGIIVTLTTMGLGDNVLPFISHLKNMDADPLLTTGDLLLSLALLFTAIRLCKKPKKKKVPVEEIAVVQEEVASETAPEADVSDELAAEPDVKVDEPSVSDANEPRPAVENSEEAPVTTVEDPETLAEDIVIEEDAETETEDADTLIITDSEAETEEAEKE